MTKSQLSRLLNHYSLPKTGSLQPLSSFANLLWIFKPVRGNWYVIKKHKILSVTKLLKLHENIEKLIACGINIPRLLRNKQSKTVTIVDGEIFEISPYIKHRRLTYINYNISASDLTKAGQLLFKLHSLDPNNFQLDSINFKDLTSRIIKLIHAYKTARTSESLRRITDPRLEIINTYLKLTYSYVHKAPQLISRYSFTRTFYTVTHNDVSLVNLLPSDTEKRLYLVDWEGLNRSPAMFELQRTIGLLCGMGKTNANLDQIDVYKLKYFLSGYFATGKPTAIQIQQLVEAAEFSSHLFWFEFTLSQILKGDFRILDILSSRIMDNFYWTQKGVLETYRNLLTRLF